MSDESAEKAWLKLPGQQRWATDREIEAFRAGRASRDAEVAELERQRRLWSQTNAETLADNASLRQQLADVRKAALEEAAQIAENQTGTHYSAFSIRDAIRATALGDAPTGGE